ncbi:MAG: hypothetical protein U5N21_15315 [Rhodococcus sp. (in: high G+C Gram-positive bacteria)]|nr:hypothetical protein [Rhodococcus sp. (in: high G+C Gram-positive bacteria)]
MPVSGLFGRWGGGAQAPTTEVAALTIRQAKAGLAKTYDVDVDAIEIVIRG